MSDEQLDLITEDKRQQEPESIYAKNAAKHLIYEPLQEKPNALILVDVCKTVELEKKIERTQLSPEDKRFLLLAAQRHNVFNYDLIADYYAHAPKEVQELMEESALVIIDFNKAIENGFVRMSDKLCSQYDQEHPTTPAS